MENLNIEEIRAMRRTVREIMEIFNVAESRRSLIHRLMDEAKESQASGLNYKALLQWNKVLTSSSSDEDLTYVYNQRSIIYMNCKLYKECLNNIMLAESSSVLAAELTERKLVCQLALEQQKPVLEDPEIKDFLKMTDPVNPRLPFAIDCLKLRRNNIYGYHVITVKDLEIGDVISVENPFITIMFDNDGEESYLGLDTCKQRCYHCFKYNNMDLIPCNNCHLAMFCTKECKDEAYKIYHKYECLVMNKLDNVSNIVGRMRPFFTALFLYNGNLDLMKASFDRRMLGQRTVFDYDFSDTSSLASARNFMQIFDSYRTTQRSQNFPKIEAIFTCIPELETLWRGNEDFIKRTLCRHIDVLRELGRGLYKWPANSVELTKEHPEITDSFQTELVRKMVGVGYYPFLGLISHACVQNISRHVNEHNQMVLVVCRPIKRGEQIFDDYMGHLSYCKVPKYARLQELWKKYSFICSCQACISNCYPLIHNQVVKKVRLIKAANDVGKGVRNWNQAKAKKKYLYLIELLQDYHTTYPTRDLSNLNHWAFIILAITTRPEFLFN